MVRRSILGLIVLSLLTFLLAVGGSWLEQSFAATPNQISDRVYYVAIGGDDASEGTLDHPWATINHAADVLRAGETVYVRSGRYPITQQIRAKYSGRRNAWITYAAFPNEQVVIDAAQVKVPPPSGQPPFPHDQGAFQLENVGYIRVKRLQVTNSHNAGFTVRDSHHVELYNNITKNTFSSGIAVWGKDDFIAHYNRVIGNTVINANTFEMIAPGFPNGGGETPHEAISIGGATNFEVAYNLVRDSVKEGIDIKGSSKHGIVHHNHVHHVERQGLYVDSWNGVLEDIELANNIVHDCKGAGLVFSAEGEGSTARNIQAHHNLIYNCLGTGILFGRWGNDGLRDTIKLYNNTVHHNGHGQPKSGEKFFWITGGLYFFSDHIQNIDIRDNIFSDNAGFQIGYSDRYLKSNSQIETVFQQKHITLTHNLIFDRNHLRYPIHAGWSPDNYAGIYPVNGNQVITKEPRFIDPATGKFYLRSDSPAIDQGSRSNGAPTAIGAFPSGAKTEFWWQTNFPPLYKP